MVLVSLEALSERWVFGKVWMQQFYRYRCSIPSVSPLVDRAHPAGAQQPFQTEMRDDLRDITFPGIHHN